MALASSETYTREQAAGPHRMPQFRLQFLLDGKLFLTRIWSAVPDIGQRVMFPSADGSGLFKVIDVLWSDTATEDMMSAYISLVRSPG